MCKYCDVKARGNGENIIDVEHDIGVYIHKDLFGKHFLVSNIGDVYDAEIGFCPICGERLCVESNGV